MNPAARGNVEVLPRLPYFVERLRAFGVVGDSVSGRAGEHEVSAVVVRPGTLRECGHDADRVLEWIPSRDLRDERRVGGNRFVLDHVDFTRHRAAPAVGAPELGPAGSRAVGADQ